MKEKNENEMWILRRKELLKNVKGFKTGDRVQMATQLVYMHNCIHESMVGWAQWLNGWLTIELNKKIKVNDDQIIELTDNELFEIHNNIKDFAIKFVEYDIKMTEIINKKLQKKKSKTENKNEYKMRDFIV